MRPSPIPAGNFSLPVQYSEKTGSDATAYLKFGDGLIATRVDPEQIGRFKQGDTVNISFPQGKLHVFDAQTRAPSLGSVTAPNLADGSSDRCCDLGTRLRRDARHKRGRIEPARTTRSSRRPERAGTRAPEGKGARLVGVPSEGPRV